MRPLSQPRTRQYSGHTKKCFYINLSSVSLFKDTLYFTSYNLSLINQPSISERTRDLCQCLSPQLSITNLLRNLARPNKQTHINQTTNYAYQCIPINLRSISLFKGILHFTSYNLSLINQPSISERTRDLCQCLSPQLSITNLLRNLARPNKQTHINQTTNYAYQCIPINLRSISLFKGILHFTSYNLSLINQPSISERTRDLCQCLSPQLSITNLLRNLARPNNQTSINQCGNDHN